MTLPEDFVKIMRPLLGDEYSDFEAALLSGVSQRGVRVNTLKTTADEFASFSHFPLIPSPLSKDAFTVPGDTALGIHPYHHAGLYYVQEPSASAAVEVLDPKPGERVLDMCAAPGGKSTHIAARLGRDEGGLLVANEIVPRRAKILSSNLERIGAGNAVICCANPKDFAELCPDFFDAVLVDAPCSGEGMFRRDEQAVINYSASHVESCAERQKLILDCAAQAVRPGGRIVYSTCTFNPIEDEGVIEYFLSKHDDFHIAPIKYPDMPGAHPEWIGARPEISLAAKPMPHLCPGEGHFIALLIRDGEMISTDINACTATPLSKKELADFEFFWKENFKIPIFGTPCKQGDLICLMPHTPMLPHVFRSGVYAAQIMRGRMEPCHSIYLALGTNDFLKNCTFPVENENIAAFLRGESFKCDAFNGFGSVNISAGKNAWSLGFGKISGGTLKNHYPKGLRNH